MAVDFVCAACAVPVGQTHAEFLVHRRVAHRGRPVAFTARMADDDRPELYLAHCARCAAEIRTTIPLLTAIPICGLCQEISAGPLEFPAPKADAAVVNPTRSDPKETSMNVTIKLTALTADQAHTAKDLGFEATKTTATFVGDPDTILAQIRQASADLKAAKKADGKKVGNAPHIDNLARKYEMAVVNARIETPADEVVDGFEAHQAATGEIVTTLIEDAEVVAEDVTIVSDTAGDPAPIADQPADVTVTPAAADKIRRIAAGLNRIPAGATEFPCATCGKVLPTKKFPTVTGPTDRATTCRPCRDGAKGAPRTPKTPGAPRTPKTPAGPKGLDPATAPYGIGGADAAEIDRTYKAAWAANADPNGIVPTAAIADALRAAHRTAHEAIVARPAKKAS